MHVKIVYISDHQNLKLLRTDLSKSRLVGVDTETYGPKKDDGLDPYVGKIRLVQIATVDRVFVLDMQRLPKAPVWEILQKLMYDKNVVKVFHNAKFDLKFMVTYFGLDLRQVESVFCTHVAYRLQQGGIQGSASLGSLVTEILGGLVLDKSDQRYNWGGTLYKEQIVYSALDAAVLLPIYRQLCKAMVANHLQIVGMLEFRCIPAVAQMELNGIKIDKAKWQDMAEKDKDQLYLVEQSLRYEFGFGDVNLGSNQQMWKLLSDMTGTVVKSRAREVIQELIERYEDKTDLFGRRKDYRPALIKYLEFSDFAKDVSTYGYEFLKHIHPITGRIHSNFHQNDTNTQRFSSAGPNLQNIPRDSERRAAFVPEVGNKYIRYDYSSFELRILAQFTRDAIFCHAFANKIDPHRLNAATQYNVPFEQVTDQQRQDIKPINFGVPYGLGSLGLAAKLKVSQAEAKKRLNKYFNDHPDIVRWHKEQFQYFKLYDCVRTPSGRVRALPDWRGNKDNEFHAQQAAKNFPIQSTNADATKLWLTNVFLKYPEAMAVNTIHDEAVFEVEEKYAEELDPLIKEEGRLAAKEVVPDIDIELEGGIADCWKK